ncbi:MAG: PAS domain S-box protein [Methylosarcina sp.]
MTTQIQPLSSLEGLMPHGMCLLWQSNLLFLHVISDGLIALSYFSIPFALLYFVIKRQDLSFRWLFILFGLFILACGTTHLLEVWTIWHPDYFFEGLAKAVTAAVSLTTAVLLWPFVPIVLKLPSPSALARANALLQEEVLEKERHENQVKLLNKELEIKVEERTQALREANHQLKQEIEERHQAERALRESEEQLKAIVESAADGIITIDQTGTIESVNAAIEAIFGYAKDELIGQDVACLIPGPDQDRHADYLAKYLETGVKKVIGIRREAKGFHKDGHEFSLDIAVTEFHREGRDFFTAIIRDITERKQADEALMQSKKDLDRAQEVANMGWWRLDILRNVLTWSDENYRIFGVPKAIPLTYETFLECVHPEDRQSVETQWRAALKGEPYDLEHRIVAEGHVKWVREKAYLEYEANGKLRGGFGISQDITERHRLEDALREVDRRKDEFLATLAHELRNPLAPISNGLHILQLPGIDNETVERVREMMTRQVNNMVRLVDELMEVSRITRGKIELHKEKIDLAEVLQSAVETSRPFIEASQHQLDLDLPTEPLMLEVDKMRLTQVFANLLNNAAKYTPEGGRIWLSARREDAQAVVSVRDNGMGIPAEMLPKVFDLFTQADRTTHRAQGGLGIGLTLVHSLVTLHGGNVKVDSEGAGQGSEFTVRLPLTDKGNGPGSRLQNDSSALPLSSRRMLVVDDNHDAADSLALLLKGLGNEVITTHNGPSSLQILENFQPTVVFLDIGMPGMDGFEVARRIRRQPKGQDITLIALTGWGQEEDRRQSREAGINHHLVKPVDLETLKALLANITDKA